LRWHKKSCLSFDEPLYKPAGLFHYTLLIYMLAPATLQFLKALNKNNNKPWFDANRKAYEAAKTDFTNFIDLLIEKYAKKDASIAHLKAKDCMFRINRDVRFSKNKSPYKNNMGASINSGGKKSMTAGYYFHLQPVGESFIGGGLYMAMPDQLKNIRQEIDYNWKEFHKIISSKQFKTVYGSLYMGDDMKLVRPPKGYEADNPAIEYIKLKSWIGTCQLSDADLTSKDLLKKTITSFEALQPLLNFLNHGLHE
jgi:uncharacterized protein (TIGR02453 family)